jgi:predicted nucleic acid-binding protein
MKVFLDANVLVSVLNKEFPLFTYSSRVLSLVDNKQFSIYTSPLCLGIAFYFAEKKHGNSLSRQKISLLSGKLLITSMNQITVRNTILDKRIHDFEDGLHYYSAIADGCKCIVTENQKDFYFSEIEVLSCRQFLEKYVL